jgi:hypothetical protein
VRDETENEEKYLWRHLMIYEYTLLLSVSWVSSLDGKGRADE